MFFIVFVFGESLIFLLYLVGCDDKGWVGICSFFLILVYGYSSLSVLLFDVLGSK